MSTEKLCIAALPTTPLSILGRKISSSSHRPAVTVVDGSGTANHIIMEFLYGIWVSVFCRSDLEQFIESRVSCYLMLAVTRFTENHGNNWVFLAARCRFRAHPTSIPDICMFYRIPVCIQWTFDWCQLTVVESCPWNWDTLDHQDRIQLCKLKFAPFGYP